MSDKSVVMASLVSLALVSACETSPYIPYSETMPVTAEPCEFEEEICEKLMLFAEIVSRIEQFGLLNSPPITDQVSFDAWVSANELRLPEITPDEFVTQFGDEAEISLISADEASLSTSAWTAGIGITITKFDEQIVISDVIADSPASQAGLQEGFVVSAIDHEDLVGFTLEDVMARILSYRGDGTEISMTAGYPDQPASSYTMTRKSGLERKASVELDGDLGIIRIPGFKDDTLEQVNFAITSLTSSAIPPKAWVLDLRYNSGGLLDQVSGTASLFLDGGPVGRIEGRTPEDRENFSANKGDILEGAPLFVLINNQTSSGAEWLSLVLQERGRATLVGSSTYGRAFIRTVFPLKRRKVSDTYQEALVLKTDRLLTPTAREVPDTGVEPDIELESASPITQFRDSLAAIRNDLNSR